MTTATAPGKVVLWGEYAVLAGAPAVVLAVNRYARCTLDRVAATEQPTTGCWRFQAQGFAAPAVECELLPQAPPTAAAAILPWHVLQGFPEANRTPVAVTMDTTAFFARGTKLGLGSSAALCVALQAAFAAVSGTQPDYQAALTAHRAAQGGRGSGIDVAASFYGGCLHFQNRNPRPCPDAFVNRCFVSLGKAVATTAKIDEFAQYRRRGDGAALQALGDCAEQLCHSPTAAGLQAYVDALKSLDKAAGLGVYSAAHLALERLAETEGLIYKPCGAGGGDIGMAVAATPEPLPRFAARVRDADFTILNLETARHGVQLDTR